MFQMIQGLDQSALRLGDPCPQHPVQRGRFLFRRAAVEESGRPIVTLGVKLFQGRV